MKFINYLEAVRDDVLNELFNIDTSKIQMKKIPDPSFGFLYALQSIGAKPDIFSKDENTVLQMVNAIAEKNKKQYSKDGDDVEDDEDVISPKKIKTFMSIFNELKNGNAYIIGDSGDFGDDEDYHFVVNDKLYVVSINQYGNDAPINISFNEVLDFNISSDYKMNSIMSSSSGGTQLFGKIRGIVEKEVPGWRKAIFSFQPILEKKEQKPIDDLNNLFTAVTDLFNKFIKGKALEPVILNKLKSSIKKAPSKRLGEIKTNAIEKINKHPIFDTSIKQEAVSFIEALFSGQKLPPPSPNLIKIGKKTSKILSTDLFNYVAIKEKNYESSARTRIYRIIIKQMFGSKVNIKQVGGTTYFSLAPIPDDPEDVW
jgi:hypothetical protein